MALAIDGSTPAVATNISTTVATVTTASFTPPAGALLLVMWAGDTQASVTPGTPTITDNLGAHLTYTLVDHRKLTDTPTGVDGQAAVWWAVVGSSAAMTVTVTSGTASGARESALKVVVITGQHATPIGAHGTSGTKSAASIAQSYTGTASSNWGFIAVCDWDLKGAETAGTGCTVINSANVASAISYGFLRRTTADGTNGGSTTLNVTLPGTSTNLCWCYVEVIPAAAGATVFPAGPVTARRRPPPRRPRSAPKPVPAQVVVTAPAKVADVGRRIQRALSLRRRAAAAPPIPTAVVPPASPPPAASLRPRRVSVARRRPAQPALAAGAADLPVTPARHRLAVWRRRPASVTPVPVQVVPSPPLYPVAAVRPRRAMLRRARPGAPAPVPTQAVTPAGPAYPTWIARARRVAVTRRRPAVPAVPVDQAAAPVLTRPRRAFLLRRRPSVPMPVPPQVAAPTAPANPGWLLRSRRVITGRSHRGAPTPVPAQVAVPPAPALPLWTTRPRRIVTSLRKGRAVTPAPAQAVAPAAPPLVPQLRTPRRALLAARRRAAAPPAPVTAVPPAPTTRRRGLLPTRRRTAAAPPVPAQLAAPAPVYPRQPIRRRIIALLLRRPGRLRFPEQPGAPVVGAVDGYARPGDGRGLSAGPGTPQAAAQATPGGAVAAQSAGPGTGAPPAQAGPGDGSTTNARGGG